MAAVSPLLRPLGIAAAGLAIVESVLFGILSLLGILISQGVITVNINAIVVPSQVVEQTLKVYLYYEEGKVTTFMGLFLASNSIWVIVSGIMSHHLIKRNYKQNILLFWAGVTYLVCIVDLAGTIVFGLAFDDEQNISGTAGQRELASKITLEHLRGMYSLAYSYAPLILMVLSARGFILWLLNLVAAVFMTYSLRNLKNNSQMESPKRLSNTDVGSIAYLYNTTKEDKDSYSRNNPTFQPEPLSAWNIQSPTVGAARRGPWSFPATSSPKLENEPSPTKILPRVGRPVTSPVAPLPPLPTPQPDYSPPLGRPVKHEPNLYDSPVRSVLKKPTQMGRTIL